MGGQVLETQTYKAYERGIAEGKAEGEARGEARGEAKGTKKFSQLIQKLMSENRYDDVTRVSIDDEYRESLYVAYGIA